MQLTRQFIVVVIILLITVKVFSQSGIYYAKSNYRKGKTNYQIPCTSGFSDKQLYDFYSNKYIKLSSAEYHKKFNKKDIWGYRDCQGFNYKIANNIHYKILEDDAIVLYEVAYSLNTNIRDFKKTTLPKYYFSKDLKSPIYTLSVTNLRKVYQFNNAFLLKLKNYLESPYSCLHCYDGHDKTYIINELLKEVRNDITTKNTSLPE